MHVVGHHLDRSEIVNSQRLQGFSVNFEIRGAMFFLLAVLETIDIDCLDSLPHNV